MKMKVLAEEVLYPALASIAEGIGCREEIELPEVFGGVSYSWCFSREFGRLKTAAICFGVLARPRRLLAVELLGSPFELSELRSLGLDGNCAVFNLSQFQQLQLCRTQSDILPPQIEIGDTNNIEGLLDRIRVEVRSLPADFWRIHEQRLSAAGL